MKKLVLLSVALLLSVPVALAFPRASFAAFNANRLMDDRIFDKVDTMNADQIDAFLNRFPNSCISTNNGFGAIEPTGYSKERGYQYGGYVSAGTVIARIAAAYDINPQVLITLLQKEQSLVTGAAGCNVKKYASAVGYACPDHVTLSDYSDVNLYAIKGDAVTSVISTCVNGADRAGFSQQLVRSAWMLKFSQQRALGNINWAVIQGNWNNADDPGKCYNGPTTPGTHQTCPNQPAMHRDGQHKIDSQTITVETGATAALYHYTPHTAGNQLFVKTFENWFGPTIIPQYAWEVTGQQAYTDKAKTTSRGIQTMAPGERAYIAITVKNTSNYTWSNGGLYPTRLGTLLPRDHESAFCTDGWASCNRPAKMTQASVNPGETATFEFWYQAPATPGTYQEHFGLVSDGKSWFPDTGLALETTVLP